MKKFFWFPVIIALSIPTWGIFLAGGDFFMVVDIPSAVFVLGITFLILLTHYTPSEMVHLFQVSLASVSTSKDEIKKALNFFATMQSLLIVSGLIGTILGFMLILYFLKNGDNQDAIPGPGRAVAASILTVFYSLLVITSITIPFTGALRKKLSSLE